MDQNTAVKTTTSPISITPPSNGSKQAVTKVEKEKEHKLPSLEIIKLTKDAYFNFEINGGTTIIKLDKYRIEINSAIKLNIR